MPKFQFSEAGGWWCQNWTYSKCQEMPKFQFLRGGWWCQNWKYSKCQEMPKFQFLRGGGGGVKTENTQSAKKCLNFNFGGGVKTENTQSAKKCLNFNFQGGEGGGGWWCQNWKYSKCQEMPKFQFWGGGRGGVGGGLVVSKLKILKVPRNA